MICVPAKVCVMKATTYPDIKSQTFGRDAETGQNEQIFNTFAMTKNAAYVVTSQMLHRVWAGADDNPYIVWSAPYDTIKELRSGQYELGSGTSPTILGEGKYVAITDNAEHLQVLVYRTAERLGPNEERVFCEEKVFDYPEARAGALSNSLIGTRLSLIAENTDGYEIFWQERGLPPSAPGFERIDINPDGRGCTKVWSNHEVASTVSGKLSTRNGLIYVYTRKMEGNVDVYYQSALDFRTGEVVWEVKVGSGYNFDNFYEALLLGPDETIYMGVYDGMVAIKDAP
jgi:outer membrane protein assembly factor BamB